MSTRSGLVFRGFLALVVATLGTAACGSAGSTGAQITSTDGEELFSMKVLGSQPGCVTCHSLTADEVLVGPSLAGVGDRAASRVPGLSATEYVRTSILSPNSHVVDGFDADKMPTGYRDTLNDAQVDALVTYLLGVG